MKPGRFNQRSWRYDASGRVVKEIGRNGNSWLTVYNDAALTKTQVFTNSTTNLATIVMKMDHRGNVIQKTDAGGNMFTNLFDDALTDRRLPLARRSSQ